MLRFGADVATLGIGLGLVGWGIWLLLTPIPGSDRHSIGVFILTVGAVSVVGAALRIWRHRRRGAA